MLERYHFPIFLIQDTATYAKLAHGAKENKCVTMDPQLRVIYATPPPPPKVRPRPKSKTPPKVRPPCRVRTSHPKSKTPLVAHARQQHILVYHSYNPRSSVTYLLRFEPRGDRFLLCFERGQPDRCLFRNINCFLAGTCINTCPDLLLNLRHWHENITWEDSHHFQCCRHQHPTTTPSH